VEKRLLAVAVAVLLSGCGDTESDTPPPEPAAPAGVYGQAPAAQGGIPSVITLESLADAPPMEGETPSETIMDQLAIAFSPTELLVQVGTTVQFQNSEVVPHNVQVTSMARDSMIFDEDTLLGETRSFTFDEEGAYDVKCNVHPGMIAFIFVTAAPYAVLADKQGAFELTGVPAGDYTLKVWSVDEDAGSEQTIVKAEGASTEVTLPPAA
jgi:plastocyanin